MERLVVLQDAHDPAGFGTPLFTLVLHDAWTEVSTAEEQAGLKGVHAWGLLMPVSHRPSFSLIAGLVHALQSRSGS